MMSDEVKSKHRYSTAALAFMMFILVGGAVIAALSGGGTPGYLVKWNTTDSLMDSIINETGNLITMFGHLTLTTSDSETVLTIDNTAGNGDPQIQFQLSGTTKTTIGIDDTGDCLEINYGSGLTTSPEFTLCSTTVTIGTAKFTTGTTPHAISCDPTPSVSTTNNYRLHTQTCSYTDFDFGTTNQKLVVTCPRVQIGNIVKLVDGGDLVLDGGSDFQCVNEHDNIQLINKGGKWVELSRAFV